MLIKSRADIKNIKTSGRLIGEILAELALLCVPDVSTFEIDEAAERLVRAAGGVPAFKGYRVHGAVSPFPATVCTSLNEEIVHGIPRQEVRLKEGDIISLDIGMEWPGGSLKPKVKNPKSKGVFTDTALTVAVGAIPPEVQKLVAVTRLALEVGIKAALPGATVAAIGKAIETYVKSQGKYGIVRALVGHGVGHAVHEEPYVPNYYDKSLESILLKPGMVVAIEPMIALGGFAVRTRSDGWTIAMADHSLCAHFEHTVIITERGNIVATRRSDEALNS